MSDPASQHTRKDSGRRVVRWILVCSLVSLWWAFLRPSSMGGPLTIITVTGESMEPGLRTDDIALVYERDSYSVGDVVAFRSTTPVGAEPGSYVIHRIKDGNAVDGYVMRGDNNDWDDPWVPSGDDIAGEMVLSVPDAGVAMRWLMQPFNLAALMSSVAIGLVVAGPAGRASTSGEDAGDSDVRAVIRETASLR